MSKRTRAEKKAEEAKIIAEMQEALKEQDLQETKEKTPEKTQKTKRDFFDKTTPETVHCKRCKTLMEGGVCPTCGWKIYVPMEKQKRDKIRLITTGIAMAIFLVLFLIMQIKKS